MMKKIIKALPAVFVIFLLMGSACGAAVTGNGYTKCDGEILPRDMTDASDYTYHDSSNKKAPSIKNETNTFELDSDKIYEDFGIDISSKNSRIDCRLNMTTAEVNKSMNLTKYINGTNYGDWVQGELNNPNVVANEKLFVQPRPEDNESGYWVEHSYFDIFPYVIKHQADGIHVDCIKVLVTFYEFIKNPEPQPVPDPVNNTTNTTDDPIVDPVPVVNNTTDVNTTDIPAENTSDANVTDNANTGLKMHKTGMPIAELVLVVLLVAIVGLGYIRQK